MQPAAKRKEPLLRITTRVAFLLVLFAFAFSPLARALAANRVEASPQAKAYRALLKAVAAGDFEAYKKSMTKASATGIDEQIKQSGMDPKKGMEMLKAMTPADLKLTSLKIDPKDAKKATLEATGKMDGELNRGTIALEQEDGQWKIA